MDLPYIYKYKPNGFPDFEIEPDIIDILKTLISMNNLNLLFIGDSGSGKTSLTKLLFRFFEPQQGSILFDGQKAGDFTLESLRNQISLVPQQPELFHRSVRDNIVLNSDVSEAQIEAAARKSGSWDFIDKLSEKFETMVGERGVKLSGGENQRIALARA